MDESQLYVSGLITVITIEKLDDKPVTFWRRLLRRKNRPHILSRQVIDATQSFSKKFGDGDILVGQGARLHGYSYTPQPSFIIGESYKPPEWSRNFLKWWYS